MIPDLIGRLWPGLYHRAAVFMSRDLTGFHARMFTNPTMPVGTANAASLDLQHNAIGRALRISDLL
ncbi:hypothetical protein GCM10011517_08950 [Actibacterium pelagium]|uniref:Uncharacterized protein n=1 Tax=Actibacterium pelagium TaxID=2029103 RepID=A0A917EJI8_9RHOB|nr:hypothetical protein GCM10011517_08950 [Actibacterium pelagium]